MLFIGTFLAPQSNRIWKFRFILCVLEIVRKICEAVDDVKHIPNKLKATNKESKPILFGWVWNRVKQRNVNTRRNHGKNQDLAMIVVDENDPVGGAYTRKMCACVFLTSCGLRIENWELREWQTIFYLLFGLQSLILDLFVFVLFCSKSPAIIAIRNRITNTHNCQYKSQIQMRVHLLLLVCTAKCLKNTQLMVLQIYECNRKNAR